METHLHAHAQNRFVAFDQRLQPGALFEVDGLLFGHSAFHNLPGHPDNVKVRSSSAALQACEWASAAETHYMHACCVAVHPFFRTLHLLLRFCMSASGHQAALLPRHGKREQQR